MTRAAFKSQLDRLTGLKFAPSTLDTHYEALSDITAPELDAAIARATKECEEFPSPKMLRIFVDDYRRDRQVPPEDWDTRAEPIEPHEITFPDGRVIKVTHRWKYYCEVCSDTGTRIWWCSTRPSARRPWLEIWKCERRGDHGEHEWTDKCPCADTNPDVQRKRALAAQVIRKQANER